MANKRPSCEGRLYNWVVRCALVQESAAWIALFKKTPLIA